LSSGSGSLSAVPSIGGSGSFWPSSLSSGSGSLSAGPSFGGSGSFWPSSPGSWWSGFAG